MTAPPALVRGVAQALPDAEAEPCHGLHTGPRDVALVAAFELLEKIQTTPEPIDLHHRITRARQAGWHDVEFMLQYCRYVHAEVQGDHEPDILDQMQEAALADGDIALEATVLALRSTPVSHDGSCVDALDQYLAQAVAMLDDGVGSALARPGAYIVCAQGYRRLGLWELEAQMYERAEIDLARPVRPGLARVVELNRAVVTFNQVETRLALACELVELGERDQACSRLAERPPAPGPDSGLPPLWVAECAAMDALLAAIVGEPSTTRSSTLLAGVRPSQWPSYQGCVLLADAVRAADRGQEQQSIEYATRAVELLAAEWMPSVYSLALSIPARAEPVSAAALSYSRRLLRARRSARQRELNSARARLRTEQLTLENKQLATKAYLDGLTGLANRYALDRHRERLRSGREADRMAVLLMDLNGFKPINDSYGHAVGDQVLRRVADLLRRASRSGDLAVRLGGDEFVLLLHGCDHERARHRLGLIARSVREADWSDLAPGMTVEVSIGAAAGSPIEIDTLLERADHDMYARKYAGRRAG